MTYLDLPEDSLLAVYAMLEYLYTQAYTTAGGITPVAVQETWKNSETASHLDVFIIADKYDLPALGEYAKVNIKRTIDFTHHDSDLYYVIEKVYTDTNSEELKSLVAGSACLVAKNEFVASSDFADLMLAIPEFAKDVAECLCGVRIHHSLHPATLIPREENVLEACSSSMENEAAFDGALKWIRDYGSFEEGTEPDYDFLRRQSMQSHHRG